MAVRRVTARPREGTESGGWRRGERRLAPAQSHRKARPQVGWARVQSIEIRSEWERGGWDGNERGRV
eukprot:scaffold2713_cov24-Tisochrysis_lutea.AAC.4